MDGTGIIRDIVKEPGHPVRVRFDHKLYAPGDVVNTARYCI